MNGERRTLVCPLTLAPDAEVGADRRQGLGVWCSVLGAWCLVLDARCSVLVLATQDAPSPSRQSQSQLAWIGHQSSGDSGDLTLGLGCWEAEAEAEDRNL